MPRRRWLAFALIPVAIGAYFVLAPRYTQAEVTVALGARSAKVRELELHFLRNGSVVRDLTLPFPDGAPAEVTHALRLRNGDYQVAARVRWDDGRESHVGRDYNTDAPEVIDLSGLR
jgi:hypothetical protein